jgi:hypothetical protein
LVQLRYRYAYSRGDRLREVGRSAQTVERSELGEDCIEAEITALQQDSRFKAVALESNSLVYGLTAEGKTRYRIGPTGEVNCTSGTENDLSDYYGIRETNVVWVGWLQPPPPPGG